MEGFIALKQSGLELDMKNKLCQPVTSILKFSFSKQLLILLFQKSIYGGQYKLALRIKISKQISSKGASLMRWIDYKNTLTNEEQIENHPQSQTH